MQNVGVTAIFMPVVSRLSARLDISSSRLLMPVSFSALVGGSLTMVGSSSLILLNDLVETSNRSLPPGAEALRPYGLFDVTLIGRSEERRVGKVCGWGGRAEREGGIVQVRWRGA